MALNIPVHRGQWIDWSHGSVIGNTHTFTVTETLYMVGATGGFLTIVGGSVWTIVAFFFHRWLARKQSPDIVTLQHRSIYRNDPTPISTIIDAFWVYWYWKSWKLCGRRKIANQKKWSTTLWPPYKRQKRAKHIGWRTCNLILPAIIVFAAFFILGIFASHIVAPAHRMTAMLIQDGDAQNQCGITLFDNSVAVNDDYDNDVTNRTRAAISYARSCYSPASGVIDSVSCSLFVKQKLNYTTAGTTCPFGNSSTPFNESMCSFNGNSAAFFLKTARLDSHEDFGINAPRSQRVNIQKQMVCSPLVIDGFNRSGTAHGIDAFNNVTVTDYMCECPLKNMYRLDWYGPLSNIDDYTYEYNTAAAYQNIPFTVDAVEHNATGPAVWIPVSNLTREDADVTAIFLAPNSICYRQQVEDPVFQATYNETILTGTGGNFTVYTPDYQVVVIGCTEQYSICKSNHGSDVCTPFSGQVALFENIDKLGLNEAQYVAAIRMIYMIADGNTYSSVDGVGADSLQLWNLVHDFVAPAIPDNQWQIEVTGWLETTLAKWQAYMVNYAYNTAVLGGHGHVGFPITNSSLMKAWKTQCRNQKINHVSFYQNVNIFGFVMIWCIGGAIFLLSLSLKKIMSCSCHRDPKSEKATSKNQRIAWNMDGKLQQQRIALRTADYHALIGGEGDVPFLDAEVEGPLPVRASEESFWGRSEADSIWINVVPHKPEDQINQSHTRSPHAHKEETVVTVHSSNPRTSNEVDQSSHIAGDLATNEYDARVTPTVDRSSRALLSDHDGQMGESQEEWRVPFSHQLPARFLADHQPVR